MSEEKKKIEAAKDVGVEKSTAAKVSSKPKADIEVRAFLRYLRVSPKKVRLVAYLVRKMDAVAAVDYLRLINRSPSLPLLKLINSAIANATNNFNLEKNNLFIKKISVNQGPSLKRWAPKAFGRATPIFKRSSHIEVVLATRTKGAQVAGARKDAKRPELKTISPDEIKKLSKRDKSGGVHKEQEIGKKSREGFTKKLFNRKSGM